MARQLPPLNAASFAAQMQALLPTPPPHIAVAVSGGADSMALCLLAHAWSKSQGIHLTALTVDHGLRNDSATEAAQVHSWLKAHNIAHEILHWNGDKPSANIQAAARNARYGLLEDWCTTHRVTHLLLGHHIDDQAETFLIRLGRGSGVDGLSAMQPVVHRGSLQLLRPLLYTSKAQLITYMQENNHEWAEDTSNTDAKYTRSRIRKVIPQLDAAGISTATLADTAQRMQRARDYLHQQTQRAANDCIIVHPAGYLLLDYTLFYQLHDEIALRVLTHCLKLMNGEGYRPRFSELNALFSALDTIRTLAGCKFEPAGDKLLILREVAAVAKPHPASCGSWVWDHRFKIHISQQSAATIGAVGKDGYAHLRQETPENAALNTLPKTAILSLPAIWHLEKPIAVPHIDYSDSNNNDIPTHAIRIDRLGHLGYT